MIIHWFRRDLRLADNRALAEAAAAGPVQPVYVLEPDDGPWPPGGASRWWLGESLKALGDRLEALGSRLVLRSGRPEEVLVALARETGAAAVHWTRLSDPPGLAAAERVRTALAAEGVVARQFRGALLFEPGEIRSREGAIYKVFTPFSKACAEKAGALGRVLPAPGRLEAPGRWPASEVLSSWRLDPTGPDWAGGLREAWRPGEAGAIERLAAFVEGPIARYAAERDHPGLASTSRLSPYLHFGEVGPLQCWVAAAEVEGASAQKFRSELLWREFSAHLLAHWPSLPDEPWRPEFAAFPWREDRAGLKAWQKGRTGYPIVDAGMRELWVTGWMHNRVRMIVASFLVKHLLIPWQEGERWFWDTLVDADLANNAASWQWVAGSGADAAPFFRIFNPVLQGARYDAEGNYVRRWVPELARLPDAHLHAPWQAPAEVLSAAGVRLGDTYPLPIVDHVEARAKALAAFEALPRAR